MRLIDADKELQELKAMEVEGETFTTAVNFAIKCMESAPTIEPPTKCIAQVKVDSEDVVNRVMERIKEEYEPKQGTYTNTSEDYEWYAVMHTCDMCNRSWMGDTNFCPNCGVKLRGKQ